ncbi:protein of unknown function [Burkholderia multivorans]
MIALLPARLNAKRVELQIRAALLNRFSQLGRPNTVTAAAMA